jgi:hypothetical protein
LNPAATSILIVARNHPDCRRTVLGRASKALRGRLAAIVSARPTERDHSSPSGYSHEMVAQAKVGEERSPCRVN